MRKSILSPVLLLLSASLAGAVDDMSEMQVLSSFYDDCNGNNWIENDNWLSVDTNICEWVGITCTSNGNVGEIELRENNVICNGVPSMIFYQLPELTVLDVSGNHEVSLDLASLDPARIVAPLSKLFMSDAKVDSLDGLEGVFPNLKALGMAGNQINGEFPSSTIASLSQLTLLDLSYNFLTSLSPLLFFFPLTELYTNFKTYQNLRNCRRAKGVKEMSKKEEPKNQKWARHKITIPYTQTYLTTWLDSI